MTKYIENCEGCGVKMVNEVRMNLCPNCMSQRKTNDEADGCLMFLGIFAIYVIIMWISDSDAWHWLTTWGN